MLNSDRPVRKEQIITALWSEIDEQINQTFHSTIYYLRKALGERCVISHAGTYSLDLYGLYGSNVRYDVALFQQHDLLAQQALAAKDDGSARAALQAMVELYQGDLTVMSWKVINKILGLAATDPAFFQALQRQPLVAIQEQGFDLTLEEQATFNEIHTNDIAEFSQKVLDSFASDSYEKRFL